MSNQMDETDISNEISADTDPLPIISFHIDIYSQKNKAIVNNNIIMKANNLN